MLIIQTERLNLREVSLSDAPFISSLLNNPTWLQFIGDRGIRTLEDAEDYIQKTFLDSYQNNGYGFYKVCLKQNEHSIGICGLIKRPFLNHPDIGFAILPEHAGKGYTYEAAAAVLDYSRTALQLPTVLAYTSKENIKSQNLLRKLGLQASGTIIPEGETEELLLFTT